MEDQQILNIINQLTEAGRAGLQHYSNWFFIAGISWVAFGVAGLLYAVKFWKDIMIEDIDCEPVNWILRFIMVALCGAIIAYHIPDILSPEGIGMHQMIIDITL